MPMMGSYPLRLSRGTPRRALATAVAMLAAVAANLAISTTPALAEPLGNCDNRWGAYAFGSAPDPAGVRLWGTSSCSPGLGGIRAHINLADLDTGATVWYGSVVSCINPCTYLDDLESVSGGYLFNGENLRMIWYWSGDATPGWYFTVWPTYCSPANSNQHLDCTYQKFFTYNAGNYNLGYDPRHAKVGLAPVPGN